MSVTDYRRSCVKLIFVNANEGEILRIRYKCNSWKEMLRKPAGIEENVFDRPGEVFHCFDRQ